jgi:hypothetical protein
MAFLYRMANPEHMFAALFIATKFSRSDKAGIK